ncbi:MAG: sigma-54 dependent transcriptional regulator [Geobacteraceae bacterium]|nr:sigma-54 dependent transcriptional regulator [Geobacteraceae bacterium]
MHRILLVDDERDVGRIITEFLSGENYEIEQVTTGREAMSRMREERHPDIVLLDLNLPDVDGMDILREMKDAVKGVPIVVITGNGSIETAVRSIKMGATDFVQKPFRYNDFRRFITGVISARERSGNDHYGIMGSSPQMRKVFRLVDKFALSDITILLQGESGTGKELFARAIHRKSKRRDGPFVPLDCAALSETLIENELFGHEKGAFTGATERKIGKFERAQGGTLFIDEIENLSPSNQAKLLRAVEEKQIERVGGTKAIKVDVRIVAASNVQLTELINRGGFRKDLFYRFNQMTIAIPSLREREKDVDVLIRHFMCAYSGEFEKDAHISEEASRLLNAYPWPGNVRELENVVKSAVILADGDILAEHLPDFIRSGSFSLPGEAENCFFPGIKVEEEIEKGLREGTLDLKALIKKWSDRLEETVIRNVMERSNLNMVRVAQFLNIDPKTLRAKISQIRSDRSRNPLSGNQFPKRGGDSLPFSE